jgi:hypothetical protein
MFEYDTDNSFSIPNNSVNRLSVKTELDIVKSDKENSISQYVGCSNKKQRVSFMPFSFELNKPTVRKIFIFAL